MKPTQELLLPKAGNKIFITHQWGGKNVSKKVGLNCFPPKLGMERSEKLATLVAGWLVQDGKDLKPVEDFLLACREFHERLAVAALAGNEEHQEKAIAWLLKNGTPDVQENVDKLVEQKMLQEFEQQEPGSHLFEATCLFAGPGSFVEKRLPPLLIPQNAIQNLGKLYFDAEHWKKFAEGCGIDKKDLKAIHAMTKGHFDATLAEAVGYLNQKYQEFARVLCERNRGPFDAHFGLLRNGGTVRLYMFYLDDIKENNNEENYKREKTALGYMFSTYLDKWLQDGMAFVVIHVDKSGKQTMLFQKAEKGNAYFMSKDAKELFEKTLNEQSKRGSDEHLGKWQALVAPTIDSKVVKLWIERMNPNALSSPSFPFSPVA